MFYFQLYSIKVPSTVRKSPLRGCGDGQAGYGDVVADNRGFVEFVDAVADFGEEGCHMRIYQSRRDVMVQIEVVLVERELATLGAAVPSLRLPSAARDV